MSFRFLDNTICRGVKGDGMMKNDEEINGNGNLKMKVVFNKWNLSSLFMGVFSTEKVFLEFIFLGSIDQFFWKTSSLTLRKNKFYKWVSLSPTHLIFSLLWFPRSYYLSCLHQFFLGSQNLSIDFWNFNYNPY